MRVSSGDADKLSKSPPKTWAAVLVFGANNGLVRERADACAKAVVDDLSDAFRVADLGADVLRKDPARLGDEAGAISMFGGRRVVRVRDATDGLSSLFEGFLSEPIGDALVVIEAGELTKTSSLRKVFEGQKNAGAIECYDDRPEDAARIIRETLSAAGWQTEPDALAYLSEALAVDRRLLRTELDKLVAYLGPGTKGTLTRADATQMIGDSGEVEADEIADAVAAGDVKKVDRLMAKAAEAGTSWTGLVGTALRLFQRLAAAQEGATTSQWGGRSSYYEQRMQQQAAGWDHRKLVKAMAILAEAEAQTRLTGFPDGAIAQQALIDVALLKRG